jgi:hypothetical protein
MAVLAACVGPTLKRVPVDPAAAALEANKQREMALLALAEDTLRLYRIQIRVAGAAAPDCGDHVVPSVGVFAINRDTISADLRSAAGPALGLDGRSKVLEIVPGSPAEKAGLRRGDYIVAIGGKRIPHNDQATIRIMEMIDGTANWPGGIPFTVERGGQTFTVKVPPRPMCAFPVNLVRGDEVNAFADGERVIINQGLVRFARGDDELAMVVAHEYAHNILAHIDAQQANATAGALVGLVFDVLAAAAGVNTQGGFSDIGAATGAGVHSQGFESEADYMGLYILARAGYDMSSGINFFRRVAAANPRSITYASSHPTSVHRVIALENAAAEIKSKQIAGLPLSPDAGEETTPVMVATVPSSDRLSAAGQGTASAAIAPAATSVRPNPVSLVSPSPGATVWRGGAAQDSCGKPWAIALSRDGDRLIGRIERDGVHYDVNGAIDSAAVKDANAGKALAARGELGPRALGLDAQLGAAPGGVMWVRSGGERTCETFFTLSAVQ